MVAVKEFSWEEISAPDFGNPARQAWHQAVTQVEEQLRTKLHVEVLPERQRWGYAIEPGGRRGKSGEMSWRVRISAATQAWN